MHLSARKLVGSLVYLVLEPYSFKRLHCPRLSLLCAYARERKSQLDVGEHALVRNEVVALEYKSYSVVAVGIPVVVLIILRGLALDYKVARRVFVESAYDVQKRRLSAAGCAENRDKLVAPE